MIEGLSIRDEPDRPGDAIALDAATALLRILRELLGSLEISPEDNFFDIGGDSLLVIQIIALLAERYDMAVSARRFIIGPTIADIAAACHPITNT